MLRVVAAVALVAFTVYTVIDIVQTDEAETKGLPKIVWVFVALLFPLVGGIAWWIAGRPGGLPRPVRDRPDGSRRGPIGPDDDPDFLGRL